MGVLGKNKKDKTAVKAVKVKKEKKVKTGKKSLKIGARISIMAIVMMVLVSTCNTTAVRFYIDLVEEQLLENGRQGMLTMQEYLAAGANESMAVVKMIASDSEMPRYISEGDGASVRRIINTMNS